MNIQLIEQIKLLNPWLDDPSLPFLSLENYCQREQTEMLLSEEWDGFWTVMTGPRRAGKTTLAKYLAQELKRRGRYDQFIYLNCDLQAIREWLRSPLFISELLKVFGLNRPILVIDEFQRLETPGLLLKSVIDLQLPIKLIATGSSQLESKSKVQEFLAGRQLSVLVLPLSSLEISASYPFENRLLHGAYPQVIQSTNKRLLLDQLYSDYINKDIIEILSLSKPDVLSSMLSLIAHSSGQLFNQQQLAVDCHASVTLVKNYLNTLQKTFVIACVFPFVGNKRTEITRNPVYYYIDNGFRNYALGNFAALSTRTDTGLLVEGYIFQELYKYKTQHFKFYDIHYWRTKGGAEVDFILTMGEKILPIEVKYRKMSRLSVSRGYRSFLEAYQPNVGIVLTKDEIGEVSIDEVKVYFVPVNRLTQLFTIIDQVFE